MFFLDIAGILRNELECTRNEWRVQLTFPTGPRGQLGWHDGFVIDVNEKVSLLGARQEYRVYFPIDSQDVRIWGPWNDPSVCFRKAHLANIKASPAEVRQAQQAAAAEWPDSD